jgi:hypothetical protein
MGTTPKAAYCASNAFIHPDIDVFNHQVKKQPVWHELMEQYTTELLRHAKYQRPGNCYRDRWDTMQFERDVEAGKTSLPVNFFHIMEEMVSVAPPAKHNAKLKGVELGPAARPMLKNNEEAHTIPSALEKTTEDKVVVSKDVWCQLNQVQKTEVAQVDGIHQYATQSVSMPSIRNPTGYWPEGNGEEGVTIQLMAGVEKTYHCTYKEVNLAFTQLRRAVKTVSIGAATQKEYAIKTGVYKLSSKGILRTGDCLDAGMKEQELRKQLEPFMLRDACGWHGTVLDVTGPVTWKLDGTFALVDSKDGEVHFSFRDGSTWLSKQSCMDFKAAFELFDDGRMYMLYMQRFKENKVELDKPLQDYLRERISFSFKLEGDEYRSQMTQEGLPRDGVVFWNKTRQIYYKFQKDKTVDIVPGMKMIISQDPRLANLEVVDEENMVPGLVYRAVVDRDAMILVPLRRPDGTPLPRREQSKVGDKILPNKPKNVVECIFSPTVEDLIKYHQAKVGNFEHDHCEFCRFMKKNKMM